VARANHCVHGLKSRIGRSQSLLSRLQRPCGQRFTGLVSLLHGWHDRSIGSLPKLVQTLGIIPFVVAEPARGLSFHDVDCSDMLKSLRKLSVRSLIDHSHAVNDPGVIWSDGSASKLFCSMMESHINSLFGEGNESSPTERARNRSTASWCSISISVELYLQYVLGIWNAGELMEPRLFLRLVTMLVKDLQRESGQNDSTFMFWIVFVCAYSIANSQQRMQGIAGIQTAHVILRKWIQRWKIRSGVSNWSMARAQLLSVTWPEHPQDLGENIWYLVSEAIT
jgi:hypothetical protein